MIRNIQKFLTNLYPSTLTKFTQIMAARENELLKEQPLISDEKGKPAKRPLSEEEENDNVKQMKKDEFIRIKRKNCAILMGYLGINYSGMQRNNNMKTIEEELFNALLKADLITQEAFEYIQSIHFQRAARTDKFVSAAGQIVNLKLPAEANKDIINKYLPNDIRVFSIKRVTKGFNSKNMCDARTYSYTLPTYSFATEEARYENPKAFQHEQRLENISLINGKPYSEYRITEEKLKKLSNVLKKFEGSHNFHNFTSKLLYLDPRTRRYIINFTCGEPFISNGMEFVTLEIKGQSFMMHQIRKMVGTVIGILRENTNEEIFDRCFLADKLDIPKAPGLGLVLKTVHMDYYNRKYGKDGIHDKLDWAECEELNLFFKNNILKYIVETEIKEKNMLTWLADMPLHTFDIRTNDEDNEEEGSNSVKLKDVV